MIALFLFRDRIVHLLAVKPQRRSDIVSRLKKGKKLRGAIEGEGKSERREGGREGGREE